MRGDSEFSASGILHVVSDDLHVMVILPTEYML